MCLPTLIVAAASVSALDLWTTTPVFCVPLRPAALELCVLTRACVRMCVDVMVLQELKGLSKREESQKKLVLIQKTGLART